MDILNLLFNVNTSQVAAAQQQVQQLGNQTQATQSKATQLSNALGTIGQAGGPIGNVAGQLQGMGSSLQGVVASATTLPGLLFAAVGAAGILSALRFAGPLDDITKLAEKFGLSATQAAVMAQNMDPGGIQTYFNAVDKVANALTKADEEGAKAQIALEALGISAKDTSDPVEVLNQLTEKYGQRLKENNLSNDEAAGLQAILGKSYRETMMQVNEAAYAQERLNYWQEAGLGVSADGAKAANDFADANDYLSDMFKIVGSQLVSIVVPTFTELIKALVDSYRNGGLVAGVFDSIKFASNLAMVPIRALTKVFFDLDWAVTSVGRAIGAVFAAIATGSTAPLAALKADLAASLDALEARHAKITALGSSGTTVAPPTGAGAGRGGGTSTPKPSKGGKAGRQEREERVDTGRFESDNTDDWQKEWIKVQADLERDAKQKQDRLSNLKRQYEDLINPVAKYYDQLSEVEELHKAGMITDNERETHIFRINAAISDLTANAKKAGEDFTLMQRIGETAFSGLEDSLVNLASTGELNFKSLVSSIIGDIMRLFVQMTIIAPLMAMLRQMMGLPAVASANGNVFGSTGILKSAKGNVFDSPTLHGYSGGIGMLGEAGPEAIMPLKRGADGKLGVVASSGGGGGVVQQNITVQVNVEGGSNAQETGDIVSGKVVQAIKGIVKQEIAVSKKAAAYAV